MSPAAYSSISSWSINKPRSAPHFVRHTKWKRLRDNIRCIAFFNCRHIKKSDKSLLKACFCHPFVLSKTLLPPVCGLTAFF